MDPLNFNVFIIGAFTFAISLLSNIIYTILCRIYKVKIQEVGIFLSSLKFSIFKKEISGTKYLLGWFPSTNYVKPLGMLDTEEEREKISPEDLPYSLFSKPDSLRTIFSFVSYGIHLLVFLMLFLWHADFTEIGAAFSDIFTYLSDTLSVLFSDNPYLEERAQATRELLAGKNIVLFSVMLIALVFFLLVLMQETATWFISSGFTKSWWSKIFGIILFLALLYFMFGILIPYFYSFFSVHERIIYSINFFWGIYVAGFVSYLIMIGVARVGSGRDLRLP